MSSDTPITKVFLYLIPFAALIWLALGFTVKRKSKFKDILNGRPGIVAPVNFLAPRNRVVYSLACAAQSSLWLQLLLLTLTVSINIDQYANSILKALYLIVLVMAVSVVTYPIVACVNTDFPTIGYTLGSLYCFAFFCVSLYEVIQGLINVKQEKGFFFSLLIVSVFPRIFCIMGINIWYIYKLFKKIKMSYKEKLTYSHTLFQYSKIKSRKNMKYVTKLLSKQSTIHFSAGNEKFQRILHIIKTIDVPLPLSIAVAVSMVIILQLTITSAFIFPKIYGITSDLIRDEDSFRRSVEAIAVLGPVSSGILLVGLMIHLLYSTQNSIKQLRRGKGALICHIHDNMNSLKLTSSVRYTGYQTASFVTGWLLYTAIITSILYMIVLLRYQSSSGLGFMLYIIFLTGLISGTVIVIQIIICKFFFFSLPDNKQKATLVIDNRRSFESFNFFTLLYSVATGLFTSTIRIAVAIAMTILVKPRLDKVVFPDPFQKLDTGHAMYRSFIITEALLNNPVVNCFVELLLEREQEGYNRARGRWHVAYTLIRNPQLVETRVRQRTSTHDDDADDDDDEQSRPRELVSFQERAHNVFTTAYQLQFHKEPN